MDSRNKLPSKLLEPWLKAYSHVTTKAIEEKTDFVLIVTVADSLNRVTISYHALDDHEAMLPIPDFYLGQVITVDDAKMFIASKAIYNVIKDL